MYCNATPRKDDSEFWTEDNAIFFFGSILSLGCVYLTVTATLQALASAAWWTLGEDGSVVLALSAWLVIISAMGVQVYPPTLSERRTGAVQLSETAVVLRMLASTMLYAVVFSLTYHLLILALKTVTFSLTYNPLALALKAMLN